MQFLGNNFASAHEQRPIFLTGGGSPDVAQKTPVQEALNEKGTDGMSLKEKAELGNLTGKELIKKAEEVADKDLGENAKDATKKTEAIEKALNDMAKELGIATPDVDKETKKALGEYQEEADTAKDTFDQRMEDLNSEEQYGGKEGGRFLNWDDDIKNAPEGSKTAEAYNEWKTTKDDLDAAKKDPKTGLEALAQNNKIKGLEKKLAESAQRIKEAVKKDRDQVYADGQKNIEQTFSKVFENHLEDKRDQKATADLKNFYGDKILDGFDMSDSKKAEQFLANNKPLEEFSNIQKYLKNPGQENTFKDFKDLQAGLNEDGKKFIDSLGDEKGKAPQYFNDAIRFNNAKTFLEKSKEISNNPSKPAAAPSETQTSQSSPEAFGPRAKLSPDLSGLVEPASLVTPADITLDQPDQSDNPLADIDLKSLSLKPEAILKAELNTNGKSLIESLKANPKTLAALGIKATDLEENAGTKKTGLQGIVELQTFLKSKNIPGADGEALETDGLMGKNTIVALETYLAQKKPEAAPASNSVPTFEKRPTLNV